MQILTEKALDRLAERDANVEGLAWQIDLLFDGTLESTWVIERYPERLAERLAREVGRDYGRTNRVEAFATSVYVTEHTIEVSGYGPCLSF